MTKLYYSIAAFSRNLDANMIKRGLSKVRYCHEDYEETDMIMWLSKHVGKPHMKEPGDILTGDGWELCSNLWKMGATMKPIQAWVETKQDIPDELQIEFALRFG